MVLRALVVAAVLAAAAPRAQAQGQRTKPAKAKNFAGEVVIDLFGMSDAEARRARRIALVLARWLKPEARLGVVYMRDRGLSWHPPVHKPAKLLKTFARLKPEGVPMNYDYSMRRVNRYFRLLDNYAFRVFFIGPRLPKRTWPFQALAKDGIGVSYFIFGHGDKRQRAAVGNDRYYWLHGKRPGPSLRAELKALRRIAPVAHINVVGAWWKLPGPCPRGARVRERRTASLRAVECRRPDGVLHGRQTVWSSLDIPRSDATYVDGRFNGRRRLWWSKGPLRAEQHYRRGVLHGGYKLWTAEGNKREQGMYRAGKRHGRWLRWDEHGRLVAHEHYRDGRPNGTWQTWWPVGALLSREHYRRGKLHGLYERWAASGRLVERGHYRNGKRHGNWVLYYNNGDRRRVGRYRNNQRDGVWRYYDRAGKVVRKEVYERGALKEAR